jgi:hypothetical protein
VVKAIAAHNSVAVRSFVLAAVEFPAGFFIALPYSVSCSSTQTATMRARRSSCNPIALQLFPNRISQIAPHRSTPEAIRS